MNSINTLRPTTIETIFKRGYGKLWHVSLNRNSTTYETKLTHLTIKLDRLLINKFKLLWEGEDTILASGGEGFLYWKAAYIFPDFTK